LATVEPDPDARPPDVDLRDRIGEVYPRLRRIVAAHVLKSCKPCHADMIIDEVVQETVREALKCAGRYDPSRPLIPWLMGFALNILKAGRRAVAVERKRFVPSERIDDEFWNGLKSLHSHDDEEIEKAEAVREKLHAALGSLDLASREAIYYRFFEGLEGRELAQALHVQTTNAARARVFRAVRKLKGLVLSGAREPVLTEDSEGEAP
jgi:RNA polymerase sigma factor (sigma-70 family)